MGRWQREEGNGVQDVKAVTWYGQEQARQLGGEEERGGTVLGRRNRTCASVGEVKFLYLESQSESVPEPGLDWDRRGHVS